jgi:hypothetical protein
MATRLTLGTDAVGDVEGFVFAMMKWGEHRHAVPRTWTREQMRAGIPDYAEVLEDVRQGYPVRYFENLLGATWHVGGSEGADGGVAILNPHTGEERTLAGVGILESPTYAAMFETAVAAWHRAVERESHADFLSALRDSVSSLEAFITRQAARWNADHPADRLEEKDKSGKFVSFRRKLEQWCPKMTGERMSPEELARLLTIKRYRDDVAVHGKHTVAAIGLNELAELLNGFTFDVAAPFFSLHRMFRLAVPSIILRAAYAPMVSVRAEEPAA